MPKEMIVSLVFVVLASIAIAWVGWDLVLMPATGTTVPFKKILLWVGVGCASGFVSGFLVTLATRRR